MSNGTTIWHTDGMVKIICANCGIAFGVPSTWRDERREKKTQFWCPNGHSLSYREGETDRLRREVQQLKQREAMYKQERETLRASWVEAENARAAAERKSAKISKRIARGVCPGCNRTFANIARHMATKHMGKCEAVKPPPHD